MLARFTGQEERHFVIDSLRDQSVIGETANLAETIYDNAQVVGFASGQTVIEESAPDNDIYFILAGVVSIRVGGREIAVRSAGQHIGEMAVVNLGQPRSASAVADGEVVAARVSARTFTDLADGNPRLWRNIARGLAGRLRQRNRFVSSMNPRPVLFVGCSTESLPVARTIQSALAHDPVMVKVWTDDVFAASTFPIESLEHELHMADFAVLVLSPDDKVISRDSTTDAPRDNTVFELGLFMGALGRSRTYVVCPYGTDIKIPTDLEGFTPMTYEPSSCSDLPSAMAPACNQLRTMIRAIGPR